MLEHVFRIRLEDPPVDAFDSNLLATVFFETPRRQRKHTHLDADTDTAIAIVFQVKSDEHEEESDTTDIAASSDY